MIHHIQRMLGIAARRLWSRLTNRPPDQYKRHRLGREAEETVAKRLREAGYRILERNFSCRKGEIDIIAFHDGKVIFVEVRSVTDPALVDPIASITPAKQQRVIRAAQRYSSIHNLRTENVLLRFDAVAVHRNSDGAITGVRHVIDAFRA